MKLINGNNTKSIRLGNFGRDYFLKMQVMLTFEPNAAVAKRR